MFRAGLLRAARVRAGLVRTVAMWGVGARTGLPVGVGRRRGRHEIDATLGRSAPDVDGEPSPSPPPAGVVIVVAMSYVQIDPVAVDRLAGGLRTGGGGLERSVGAIDAALLAADLLDDTPWRLSDRIERWLDIAQVLHLRAEEASSFELDLRGADGGLRLVFEHDDGRLEVSVSSSVVDTVDSWIDRITSIRPRPANPHPDPEIIAEGLDGALDLVRGAVELGARGHDLLGEGAIELGRRHLDDLGRTVDLLADGAEWVLDQQPVDPFGSWGVFGPNGPLAAVGDARRILPVLARQTPESLEFYAREFFDDPRDSAARAAGLWLRPDTSICLGGGYYHGVGGGASACLLNADGEGAVSFTTERGYGFGAWFGVDAARLLGLDSLDDLDGVGSIVGGGAWVLGLDVVFSGDGDPILQVAGSLSAGAVLRVAETNTHIHRAPQHGPFDTDDEADEDD